MVKGIIENTHIISSKITKFIWFLGYYNFSKINMYFEIEEIYGMRLEIQQFRPPLFILANPRFVMDWPHTPN